MGSRRRLGLFLLVVLVVLCLHPCCGGSDDPALGDNKVDEGGIFGFTLSSFLFGSDDEDNIKDNVFVEKSASQDSDDTEDNHGDTNLANDEEDSGREEKKQTDEHGETKTNDFKESDDDEVPQLDQFIDVDEKFNSKGKYVAGSRKVISSSTHNNMAVSFPCSQTPDLQHLSHYMQTCQNCLVLTDRHTCPLHEAALELKKQMTELQELLSYGCRNGGCSHDSRCCHNSDVTLMKAVQEMTLKTKHMHSLFLESCSSCPRDGGWSEWCEWGACSVTCGEGTRTRSRKCNNTTPRGRGRPCPGPDTDSISCSSPSCCAWSSWGSWSVCAVTCGQGMVERRRSCVSPTDPFCPQSQCPGSGFERSQRQCGPDPSDGSWGAWQRWSSCSVTCGRGTRSRTRRCNSPAPNVCGRGCYGESVEREECNELCPSCEWNSWGSWSSCSVTCGEGVVERSRRCLSPFVVDCSQSECAGPAIETRREQCGSYSIDGNWGSWQQWTFCSVTCGSGTQQRMRLCDSPAHNECGRECVGAGMEQRVCFENCDLCVDGNWGQWGSWGECISGLEQRLRRCDNPPPNECGRLCPGSNLDVQSCGKSRREWSSWEPWCPCDCRKGTRTRRRSCQARISTGELMPVDLSFCGFTESREEEVCDVRRNCPACVRSCRGLASGTYPSCTSCSNYVTCNNDEMNIQSCSPGFEYDAFIARCAQGESPSCTLRDCVTSCEGQSGRIPSCQSVCSGYFDCKEGWGAQVFCRMDQEFNAQSGRCGAPPSPTCKSDTSDVMYGDAPADSYFDIEDENAEEKYKELLKQNGMAAMMGLDVDSLSRLKFEEPVNKTDTKGNTIVETTRANDKKKAVKSSRMSKDKEETVQCQTDCAGLAAGLYQSCMGCENYLICTKYGISRLGHCPSNKVWDDRRKKCRKTSVTCKPSAPSDLDAGTS